ncbi:hypothetical protein P8C59_004548 [Phyllachora maydis]|uniref:Zn(2)-C6 fungal-type domain-containing protein n=1 Tax=Phyllachora maydis TaxID=1825666 RepID=A0AAD9I2L5_9PEZI|nr:hypothetical protein P8C59_004548 [Phyllachora maydis]
MVALQLRMGQSIIPPPGLLCRRNKVKCDGRRPHCTLCASRGRHCRYVGEVGESRQAAMKSRLRALEGLFQILRDSPPGEGARLLGRLLTSLSATATTTMSTADIVRITRDHSVPNVVRDESHVANGDSPLLLSTCSLVSQETKTDASRILFTLVLPKADIVRAAVDMFFATSGKLFHVFSAAQINAYLDVMFDMSKSQCTARRLAICAACIVAAVGVTYHTQDFAEGQDEEFYSIAKHYFLDLVEQHPLEAIQLSAMLCMYNVMTKAMAALGYVEVGMSMCRTTWRTLLFLSGWLSSTLGYISASELTFEDILTSIEPDADHMSAVAELVQTEMIKISLLSGNILKMHLASRDFDKHTVECIIRDLQEWHNQLPPQIQLGKLSEQDLPDSVRRSIFHVHLLYLGAFMLLYRRIASRYFQLVPRKDVTRKDAQVPTCKSLEGLLLAHAEQGVVAAQHSARILGLLLADDGIARRCWLVIFQANTACIVLLHTALQKRLHHFPETDWGEDLTLARHCLNTLKFCGSKDIVALEFHDRLSPMHALISDIRDGLLPVLSIPPDLNPIDPRHSPSVVAANLSANKRKIFLVDPHVDTEHSQLAWSLRRLLCQPFGERPTRPACDVSDEEKQGPNPVVPAAELRPMAAAEARRESAGGCKGAAWDLDGSVLVDWQADRLGLGMDLGKAKAGFFVAGFGEMGGAGATGIAPLNGRFLGSYIPSGWTLPDHPTME